MIEIPYPPSVNGYWRTFRNRQIISKAGRLYRTAVAARLFGARKIHGRLHVTIYAFPPDKRRRDLDNVLKAPLDALAHAGVYADDSQIDRLDIVRMGIEKPGRLEIDIREIPTAITPSPIVCVSKLKSRRPHD